MILKGTLALGPLQDQSRFERNRIDQCKGAQYTTWASSGGIKPLFGYQAKGGLIETEVKAYQSASALCFLLPHQFFIIGYHACRLVQGSSRPGLPVFLDHPLLRLRYQWQLRLQAQHLRLQRRQQDLSLQQSRS